ncbi:MAG: aminotransferase class IV [Planctomycetota bacterium]
MATVFLNGSFVDAAEARVSAFDAGFQHAVGLFETMLATPDGEDGAGSAVGSVVGLVEHCERLAASARELRLLETVSAAALADACVETISRSGLTRARLRLTVTGGDLNLLERGGTANHDPTVMVVAQPATEYPNAMYEQGVLVTIADAKANPLDPTAGHKTLNYWWRLRELQIASSKGAAEALVFQVSNHLSGGCVSNLLAVKGDRLLTPICRGEEATGGVPSPVLPGVTRGMVMGWAEEAGLELERRMMTIDDVLQADELMLTNSSWGVLPVTRLEAREVGSGGVGPVTNGLLSRWRARIGTA